MRCFEKYAAKFPKYIFDENVQDSETILAFYAHDYNCHFIFQKVEKLDKMVTELAGFQQYVSRDSI